MSAAHASLRACLVALLVALVLGPAGLVAPGALAVPRASLARSATAASGLAPIRHVFLIVLENKGFDETFGYDSAAPYLSLTLPGLGALVPNYYSVTHQSLANYVAMISGQGSNPLTQADCPHYENVLPGTIAAGGQALGIGCVYPAAVPTLAGQLAMAGLSWHGYMEDMGNAPGQAQACRHETIGGPDRTETARVGDEYAMRHNPFVYFHSIIDTPACARDDVPLDRLPGDLRSVDATPNFSLISPNLCDDGHDAKCVDGRTGGLRAVNVFLRRWVPLILASPAYRRDGLLIVTFDESDGTDARSCCGEPAFPSTLNNGFEDPGRGGGRVGAVMLSPFIDPGTIAEEPYNHFSMLRSVEDIFGLSHLGFAAEAGLRSFGGDVFTCFAPASPRARSGRLPAGWEIKLAVIGQGTAARPSLELKLWHAGRLTVSVRGSARHRTRPTTIVNNRPLTACQPAKVGLRYRHGSVTITARAFGGSERRTIAF
ncbi:MAG: alkaline phosphatase family protein [Solirubrobacteraceae bacterium]